MDPALLHELQDPMLPPTRLAEIAWAEPASWPLVIQHPAVYADLVAWIHSQATPQATADQPAISSEPAVPIVAAMPSPSSVDVAFAPTDNEDGSAQSIDAGLARKASWILAGIGIGLVLGAAVSAALILWVLPGLFGGALG